MTRFTGQPMFSEKEKLLILMLEICREIDTTTIFLFFFLFTITLGMKEERETETTKNTMQKEKLMQVGMRWIRS